MDWVRGYKLYKRIKRLVRKYTGKPLDVMAVALMQQHPDWRKHIDVVAEAVSAYRATHPGATDREISSIAVARLARHML